MKKIVYTLIFTAFTVAQIFAQAPVVVGGAQKGNENATMEILSQDGKKGFMPPRLTTDQVTTLGQGLNTASNGLTVFNTDTNCLQYWKGDKWSDCSTYSNAELTADCTTSKIVGVYNVDKIAGDNEYLELKANVTKSGPFVFYSDTKNGIRFYLSTILEIGNQTIVIPAVGTPKAAGTFNYNLFDQAGNPICTGNANFKTVVVENNAIYTIKCGESAVIGNFFDNVSVSGQTLRVKVAVSTPGNYYIKTNTLNGLWFEGSGTVNLGTTDIILEAKGIANVINGDSGVRTFTLQDKNSTSLGCTVTTSLMAPKAVFTIDCYSPKLFGVDNATYSPDYIFRDVDKLTISINATRTGPISLSTDPNVPMVYSYVGIIEKPGVQTITLTPTTASINYHGPWDNSGYAPRKFFDLQFFNYGIDHPSGCRRGQFFLVWDYIAKYTFSNGPVDMNQQTDQQVFDKVKLFVPITGNPYVYVPAIFTEGGIIKFSGTAAGITITCAGTAGAPGETYVAATMTGTLTSTGVISFPIYDELTGDFKGGFTINFKG